VKRLVGTALAVTALVLLAACGSREIVREPTVLVPNSRPAQPRSQGIRDAGVRIAVVRLGVLAHVGQPEQQAGYEAGRRFARAGARRVVCVNQLTANQGLDARCRGLDRALRRAGGRTRVIRVDDQSAATPGMIAAAIRSFDADAVLGLNATTGTESVDAVRRGHRERDTKVATFDLGPDVLRAVRRGRIAFAIDQQAYLQGYLPVILLAQRARFGLFPARRGELIPTGPNFVTRRNAGRVIELARRSIR
jgi:simple sugar transport system substrate-binding protein